MNIWRCKRCHNDQWVGVRGWKQCAACGMVSDVPDTEIDYPIATVRIVVECDACGHRESVLDEVSAKKVIADHVKGCRKAHKGVART